jgi:dienelactone hydrolase
MLFDMPIQPRLLLSFYLCGCAIGLLHAQTIEITPSHIMDDEQATIRITGLQPHEQATLRAALVDGAGNPWQSQAEFVADDAGTVDTSRQAPTKGSYRTVSAMGLVWSMTPAAKDVHSYRGPRNDQIILLTLMKDSKPIANAQFVESFYPQNIHRAEVEGQLHGVLFVPDAPGPHPGVLVLGGSEGGTPSGRAIWLASHGYSALALAYFHVPGLPQQLKNIPLEYFGEAIGWMMQRPEIDPKRIAVMGASRGGELALQLGSMYPQLHAVVAFVPANVRYPSCCDRSFDAAWTWKGQALAYAIPTRSGPLNQANDLAAEIAVEKTHGPILVIGGEDDGVWASSSMTQAVIDRLKRSHFANAYQRLNYPHAGHRAGNPVIEPTWSSGMKHPLTGESEDLGGTPEGNAASSLDAIPKVLDFLQQSFAVAPAQAQ